MERKHNASLTANARSLRKNMTKEERHLWYDFLRAYPVRFLRQKVIDNYIVDFYCSKARLIVELDGSQHYEAGAVKKDEIRTEFCNREICWSFVFQIMRLCIISKAFVNILIFALRRGSNYENRIYSNYNFI